MPGDVGLIVLLGVLAAMAFIVWLAVRDTKRARGGMGVKRSDEPDEKQGSGKAADGSKRLS